MTVSISNRRARPSSSARFHASPSMRLCLPDFSRLGSAVASGSRTTSVPSNTSRAVFTIITRSLRLNSSYRSNADRHRSFQNVARESSAGTISPPCASSRANSENRLDLPRTSTHPLSSSNFSAASARSMRGDAARVASDTGSFEKCAKARAFGLRRAHRPREATARADRRAMRANIDVEHTAVVAVTPARICASERTKSEVGVGVDTKTRLCRWRRRRRRPAEGETKGGRANERTSA